MVTKAAFICIKGVVDFSRLDCVYGVQSNICVNAYFFFKRIIFPHHFSGKHAKPPLVRV